jgi:chorismate-pyruvate lyase
VSEQHSRPDLETLIGLFYDAPADLGEYDEVSAETMPAPFRNLLAHNHHMTVTVESFHGCAVNVEVLDTQRDGFHYSRKILLRRATDDAVVQFGIVRLDLRFLTEDVITEITSEKIPLGRVLIQHNVMREVQLAELWRFRTGPDLERYLGTQWSTVYGRTALIYCNGEPVIELLEIVTPS